MAGCILWFSTTQFCGGFLLGRFCYSPCGWEGKGNDLWTMSPTLLKRSSRIVDRRLGMALVGLLSVRREEVLPADKESDRLYNRSQVCRESVYFNLHKWITAVM